MMRELLAFLEVADNDFKSGLTTQISLAAERFAPNKRWHIDTVLRTLTLVSTRNALILVFAYDIFRVC
jgi:AP-1 complex subunit gamma-1